MRINHDSGRLLLGFTFDIESVQKISIQVSIFVRLSERHSLGADMRRTSTT